MMKLPPSLGPLHVCGFESKSPQHIVPAAFDWFEYKPADYK
ncbi:hypothetical protein [Paenibacillus alginolyticus]|nr:MULTISPECIES: hypothetical protein [Paenibacillus]